MEQKFPQQNSLEQTRQNLAEKVRLDLEKYKDQVTQFNLTTSSSKAGGFFETNTEVKPFHYDDRYKNDYELHKIEGWELMNSEKTGHAYDKAINKITFQGYLGRTLHSKARDGNALFATLKFNKGFEPHEVIESISKLMETLVPYAGNDKNPNRTVEQDLVDISKEGIQVLEAFKGIAEKFPSNGRISVQSMIDEYKEILEKNK